MSAGWRSKGGQGLVNFRLIPINKRKFCMKSDVNSHTQAVTRSDKQSRFETRHWATYTAKWQPMFMSSVIKNDSFERIAAQFALQIWEPCKIHQFETKYEAFSTNNTIEHIHVLQEMIQHQHDRQTYIFEVTVFFWSHSRFYWQLTGRENVLECVDFNELTYQD